MLIDTFLCFLKYWDGTDLLPVVNGEAFKRKCKDSWIEYIKNYPELYEKIKWDYERYKMDWHEYLKLLSKRSADELKLAHENLLKILPEVEEEVKKLFDVPDYNIVIYVGLENGAGWVTEFKGKPSILFGLEVIAELGWYKKIKGLAAHEFGHLIHWLLRKENVENLEDEQIMWLYTEGFAQRIEDLISGRPWHLEEEEWFE